MLRRARRTSEGVSLFVRERSVAFGLGSVLLLRCADHILIGLHGPITTSRGTQVR
jgi:hypothetical protein